MSNNPANFFDDFDCAEFIDYLYIDKITLISLEDGFLDDVRKSLEEAENYELAACLRDYVASIKKLDKKEL